MRVTATAALAALVAACSFIVDFDPEGQPCNDGRCLPGYACVDGRCRKGADAGACGGCAPGQFCRPSTQTCVPNTCQYRRCGVGLKCSDATGIPTCREVEMGQLGQICTDDRQCQNTGVNRVCYRGAVQLGADAGGGLRTGICVELCRGPSSTCITPGATCRTFPAPQDAGATYICVPDGILSPCTDDSACADDGLVCTVFDHPQIGPATVCDTPLAGGAGPGEACVVSAASGGNLCANGLCVPRADAGQAQTCGQLCHAPGGLSTCSGGRTCALVEFEHVGVVRHLPMCVETPTVCAPCAPPGACGTDAPHCTAIDGQLRCLSACSPDAGSYPACPFNQSCRQLDGGVFRCVPITGCG